MRTGPLIAAARREAGLSQSQLARRLGTTQSAVARLERRDSNPRIATLDRALRGAGRRLELRAVHAPPAVDEGQIAQHLRMSPAERAASHDAAYRSVRELMARARPSHGDMA